MQHLKKKPRAKAPDAVDVCIVGAGPAGLACAAGCKEAGLSFRILEQDTVGGTVAHFPRNKVVMTEQVVMPFYGPFGRSLLSKEELLEEFEQVMALADIQVEEGNKVTGIDGEEGAFVVHTNQQAVQASVVVLATGLRGSPRKLGVPGEERDKVMYRLVDPLEFVGQRVLVVGGGDSAVEAAIQLANESNAKVTISYRKDAFSRAKPRNRELIAELAKENRVRLLMSSQVKKIGKADVTLTLADGKEAKLRNDAVIICAGGEVPSKFLNAVGVSMRTYHEEARSENEPVGFDAKDNRRLATALFALGGLIVAGLTYVGGDYYWLDQADRETHPLHQMLRPAGLWGHSVGIIATLFMLSNFLYVARKRLGWLKNRAHIRTWLTMHMFVGVMSPIVIIFHAAFQSNNMLAVFTGVALTVVVGTGVFGRFIFKMVPAADGKLIELDALKKSWREKCQSFDDRLVHVTNALTVQQTLMAVTEPPKDLGMIGLLLYPRRHRENLDFAAERVRRFFDTDELWHEFRAELDAILRTRLQVAFYSHIKRFFRLWLSLHVVLALFMVVLIVVHVAVSIYLGYAWIFSSNL